MYHLKRGLRGKIAWADRPLGLLLSPSLWPPLCPASPALQIMQKLTSLPFQQCKHHISSLDAQPSLSGGVLVFVTGQLLVGGAGGTLGPLPSCPP